MIGSLGETGVRAEMLDEWEQQREDDLARDIFGDDNEVGYYDYDDYDDKPDKLVVMRSALKHLIVAGIEIHKFINQTS